MLTLPLHASKQLGYTDLLQHSMYTYVATSRVTLRVVALGQTR